jgi:sterol desaturase/sphingolipid hydroxylase (fatty acid hydroxylase superfamily)
VAIELACPGERMDATPTALEPAASGHRRDADALSESPRLFANPLLDKLSRVRWWVPPLIYGPCVLALLIMSVRSLGAAAIVGGAAFGYLVWTLTEYLGHRFAFHARLPGEWGTRLHFLIHGVHHDHPGDPLRLVMPALLSAPIMLVTLANARFAFGLPGGLPPMMGFLIGYLGYDMTHHYVHHGAPTTQIGRALRRHHMRHHFEDASRGFGVSAPWWDHLFGTAHAKAGRRAAAG